MNGARGDSCGLADVGVIAAACVDDVSDVSGDDVEITWHADVDGCSRVLAFSLLSA